VLSGPDSPSGGEGGYEASLADESGIAAYAISAGEYSTCELQGGRALCWGANTQGTLGTGDMQDRSSPTPVRTTNYFETIVVGDVHACGVLSGPSDIACWGGNGYGQLGIGNQLDTTALADVALATSALLVKARYEFTCAILADHSLWCWGENDEGQLGQNDQPGATSSPVPLRVGSAADWLQVAAGQGHACGIRAPGTLWCWGRNVSSELGLGPGQPIQIRVPTLVAPDSDWASLDVGQDQACAIKQGGTLWCWGDNTIAALGLPQGDLDAQIDNADADEAGFNDAGLLPGVVYVPIQSGTDSDWAQVSIDVFHGCALKQGGTLWCWGRNDEGQLGMDDNTDRPLPTQVGTEQDWLSVSVGRFHTCAMHLDHSVSCAGANGSGQLGVGDDLSRNLLTAVSAVSTP
jgi:alpha-tubulin suppressor-like RCC1 family protein